MKFSYITIFFTKIFRRLIKAGKKPFSESILVLGDSHASAFNFFSPYQLISTLIKYQFTVCSVVEQRLMG